ncbi:MAG TPA: glycosyltransferase family 87 protein [Xanthobacteraceae bacterium]|nr:glycosyltransferase family 87 protein [Xanthobacteraceae bacterium]
MDGVRDMLRSGDWLTRERVRLVATALLIASAAGFLFLVVTAHGAIDRQGRPLGTDFSNVYAAGTYALEGRAAAAFDPPQQFKREQQIFGKDTQFYGWHYPPFFLFVAAALAWMPYGVALAVWQSVTLALYLLVMRAIVAQSPRITARDDRLWLLLALAFPAVLINIGHGQNGFLTAALMGGALIALDRRPIAAGILFGLMVYKPQYGLMIPLVLAASGRWKCFASAAATVALLALVTTLVFGLDVWRAFLASTEFTRTVVLEQGNTGWHKIQSVFAWARMWGAPIPLAYLLQGGTILGIGAALVWLWRSAAPYALKAAALCLAAILATPYSFDYDMMVLAPAIAFIAVDGFSRNFDPWGKTVLAALWLVPLFARSIAQISLIPLGVPAMLAVFVLILQRSGFSREFAGEFDSSVAFSGAPTTFDAVADEAVPANQVVAETRAAKSSAGDAATTSPR